MSAWLIAFVGVVYAVISAVQFMHDNPSMGMVFAGYAFSNIGLWMVSK